MQIQEQMWTPICSESKREGKKKRTWRKDRPMIWPDSVLLSKGQVQIVHIQSVLKKVLLFCLVYCAAGNSF